MGCAVGGVGQRPAQVGQVAGSSGPSEPAKPAQVAGASGGGGIFADAMLNLAASLKGLEALIAGTAGGGASMTAKVGGDAGAGVRQMGQVQGDRGTPKQVGQVDGDRDRPEQVTQVEHDRGRGRGRRDKPGWGNGGFGPPGLMLQGRLDARLAQRGSVAGARGSAKVDAEQRAAVRPDHAQRPTVARDTGTAVLGARLAATLPSVGVTVGSGGRGKVAGESGPGDKPGRVGGDFGPPPGKPGQVAGDSGPGQSPTQRPLQA